MVRRLAIGVLAVTLAGCTYPRTKMEPVNPTRSDGAQPAAHQKGSSTAPSGAR